MQIQVNANSSLHGDNREALDRWAETELQTHLQRFRAEITRIEVHLSDENSVEKGGAGDKRSLLEARLANHPPLAASHHAPTLDEAFRGSMDKLKHALESTLDRQKKHRDRESIRFDTTDATLVGDADADTPAGSPLQN